ncbi:MAG: DUF2177 family protein [Chitinophagales bacterium]|nr:DUF2177 family protein [Chitinophagales bacterium]MDW8274361.1 DUF2177 family protein [Chitinophagales bacterium]
MFFKHLIHFIFTVLAFITLDLLWLGFVAKQFYRSRLHVLLSDEVNWFAAGVFYIIYTLGMIWFVVLPATKHASWSAAILNGALLGGICYATYDLTNHATLKNWPPIVSIVDILWGIFITSVTCVFSYAISTKFILD